MMLNRGRTIDFDSNIPYYIQLIEALKEKLGQGEWKPGDRLPSEAELCDLYRVSRTVVRQALREIELDGLILRRKGKGSFVAEPKISESLAQKLTGFYQDMVERGHEPVTRVLGNAVVPASKQVARSLAIQPGTPVVEIKRLRFVEGEPIVIVTSYLPYELCPQLPEVDLTNRSLYEFLEQECGLMIARGRRAIEAVGANEFEAELLQVNQGAPLILLDSVSYLEDGTPIEYYHALHRGDRSRFEVELVRIRAQGQVRKTLAAENIALPSSNMLLEEPLAPGYDRRKRA
jgi:GntR family transcriptional regulator